MSSEPSWLSTPVKHTTVDEMLKNFDALERDGGKFPDKLEALQPIFINIVRGVLSDANNAELNQKGADTAVSRCHDFLEGSGGTLLDKKVTTAELACAARKLFQEVYAWYPEKFPDEFHNLIWNAEDNPGLKDPLLWDRAYEVALKKSPEHAKAARVAAETFAAIKEENAPYRLVEEASYVKDPLEWYERHLGEQRTLATARGHP